MKKVVYSCLFSDGKRTLDIPCIKDTVRLNEWDYVMFTNVPDHLKDSGWVPIYKELIQDHPIYTAKHYKWLVHKYLLDYDIAIYVDAYLSPIVMDWNKYIDKLKPDGIGNGIILMRHSRRNCIYDECSAISNCRRDTKENMDNVITFLKENNMPKKYGLSEGGLSIRHLKNNDFNSLCDELFTLMLRFTYRDQALLSYVLWKNNTKVNCELTKESYCISGKIGNHVYT